MRYDCNRMGKVIIILVCFLVLSVGACLGTGLQQRQNDAVILTGENLSALVGTDVGQIRVYRYNAAADSFQPVPFQVDERNYNGDYFAAHNGQLDYPDEVVFMAQDLGDQAASDQVWPDDDESKRHKRYECAVSDPLNGDTGYIYVFVSSTLPVSPDGYVEYAAEGVTTRTYHVGHNPDVASGLPDTLYVRPQAGGDGVDFISKQRLRIWTTADMPSGIDDISVRIYDKCSIKKDIRSTLGKIGELRINVYHNRADVKSGAVRILRNNIIKADWSADAGVLGSGSGTFNIPIGFRYYADFFEVPYLPVELDLSSFLDFLKKVDATLRYSSVYYTMMLNDNGKNMRFYTPRLSNPTNRMAGFKIDGPANEGYFYSGDLQPEEWPGQHWYAVTADAADPASVVQKATVFTHLILNGNQPTAGPEQIFFMEIPGDDQTVYGDAGIRLYQSSGLPSKLALDVLAKYYLFPTVKTYDELQSFFDICANAVTIESEWQSNDKQPPAMLADLAISAMTETSLTLSWTAVGDDGLAGGAAAYYMLRYNIVPVGQDTSNWWYYANPVPIAMLPAPAAPGTQQQYTVENLEFGKPYYFGMRVVDDVGNASRIKFIDGIPTPVELASFFAKANYDRVYLYWTTKSESNNLGFAVERRVSAESAWEQIAFLNGAGTTTMPRNYTYVDPAQSIGRFSYRLRQIDTDGRSTYSDEVTVQISAPQTLILTQNYPNPFNPNTTLSYHLPQGVASEVELVIYDLLGRQVRALVRETAKPGYYQVTWDGRDDDGRITGSGVYIYILRSGAQHIARKMIKVD